MKKSARFALALLLVLALSLPVMAIEPVSEDAISISSPCAILVEKTTGTVIYEKNAKARACSMPYLN